MKYYSLTFGGADPRTYSGLAPTMLIFVNMTTGATLAPPAISESLASSGIYQFQYGTTQPIVFLADAATTSPGTAGRYVSGQLDPADRIDEIGTTLVAIGTSHIAQGVTIIAIGTSHLAQGVSILAFGVSSIAQGVTLTAIGTTLFGIGTTNFALGTTINAIGTTLIGYGASNFAYGTSIFTLEQAMASTLTGIGATVSGIGATVSGIGVSLNAIMTVIGSTASSFGTSAADPVDLFGYLKRMQENLEGNSDFTKLSGVWNIKSRGGSLLISKTVANSSSQVIKS